MKPAKNYRIEVDRPVRVVGADGRSFFPNLDPDRPDYVTPDQNLVPAIVWAIANGWRDPSDPDWWSDELAEEVARGGAEPWPFEDTNA